MKKKRLLNIFIFISTIIMILPFCVDAKSNVKISSVEPRGNDGTYLNFENPTFDELTINIKGLFSTVGENVQYKVTFENKDNSSYTFADYEEQNTGDIQIPTIDFSKSEYISYTLLCEDGYTLKANSTKECNLSVSYVKEVPTEMQQNGFTEKNQISIKMVDPNGDIINNPSTGMNHHLIIFLLTLAIVISLIVILKRNKKLNILSLILVLSLIPMITYASNSFNFTINGEITIGARGSYASNPTFCYKNPEGEYSVHTYEEGMTWMEYIESEYNTLNFWVLPEHPTIPWGTITSPTIVNSIIPPQNNQTGGFGGRIDTENDLIMSADECCYTFINS